MIGNHIKKLDIPMNDDDEDNSTDESELNLLKDEATEFVQGSSINHQRPAKKKARIHIPMMMMINLVISFSVFRYNLIMFCVNQILSVCLLCSFFVCSLIINKNAKLK